MSNVYMQDFLTDWVSPESQSYCRSRFPWMCLWPASRPTGSAWFPCSSFELLSINLRYLWDPDCCRRSVTISHRSPQLWTRQMNGVRRLSHLACLWSFVLTMRGLSSFCNRNPQMIWISLIHHSLFPSECIRPLFLSLPLTLDFTVCGQMTSWWLFHFDKEHFANLQHLQHNNELA